MPFPQWTSHSLQGDHGDQLGGPSNKIIYRPS